MANTQVTNPIDRTNNPDGIDNGYISPSDQLLAELAHTSGVTTDDPEPPDPSLTLPYANKTLSEKPGMLKGNDPPTEGRETSSCDAWKMLASPSGTIEESTMKAATNQHIGIGTKRKFSSGKNNRFPPIDDIFAEPPSYTQSRVDVQLVADDLRPQQRQKRHHEKHETHEPRATVHRLDESAVEVKISIPITTSSAVGCSTSFTTINAVIQIRSEPSIDMIDCILDRWGTDEFLVLLADGSTIWSPRYDLQEEMVQKFESSYEGLDLGADPRKFRFKGPSIQYYIRWEGRPTTESVWVDEDLISPRLRKICADGMWEEDWVEDYQE